LIGVFHSSLILEVGLRGSHPVSLQIAVYMKSEEKNWYLSVLLMGFEGEK
jgi:hypothetical protein